MNDSLKHAHQKSSGNRAALLAAPLCGCFYCLRIFEPAMIVEWVHDGETATCPFCSIDAIIPQDGDTPIDPAFLKEMKREWF